MSYLLAGDVGGTKTVLCLYQAQADGALVEQYKSIYPSSGFAEFSQLIAGFLQQAPAQPERLCLGIAGPIHDQVCDATNLPWLIDAGALAAEFGFDDVYLINDLEAAAYGMLHLSDDEFVELNPQAKPQSGHIAVLAAGTGLGEAILFFDGQHYSAMPSEGGHCDFGPNTAQEDALLAFLRERFDGHVSYERILAGAGFGNLYDFLKHSGFAAADPDIETEMFSEDRNAVISRHGLLGDDALCVEALRLFVRIYGAEAGNLALKSLPRAGVYIGGGIGPKIQSAMLSGEFMRGFLDKARMAHAIADMPVRLALNPEAPLLGAAHQAQYRFEKT